MERGGRGGEVGRGKGVRGDGQGGVEELWNGDKGGGGGHGTVVGEAE